MPLSDVKPSLICSKSSNMTNSINDFDAGVSTFVQLYSNYISNKCFTKIKDTNNFQLTGLDENNFVRGVSPNPLISTNCKDLNDSLIKYATEIDKARKIVQAAVTQNYDQYKTSPQFTQYIEDSKTLKNNYQKLVNKRQELDTDMQQLLGYENSLLYEKQGIIDSSVYTTLLWTVLATSVLYYTFTKL